MLNIQRQQTKKLEDEDSEDDLNGWDFKQKLFCYFKIFDLYLE